MIKFIAHGQRWFDRGNGNTYHSVKITRCKDGKTIKHPITYGYGDAYRQTALKIMAENKWLPPKYRDCPRTARDGSKRYRRLYERENNYPIHWSVTDGLKRDCVANGE